MERKISSGFIAALTKSNIRIKQLTKKRQDSMLNSEILSRTSRNFDISKTYTTSKKSIYERLSEFPDHEIEEKSLIKHFDSVFSSVSKQSEENPFQEETVIRMEKITPLYTELSHSSISHCSSLASEEASEIKIHDESSLGDNLRTGKIEEILYTETLKKYQDEATLNKKLQDKCKFLQEAKENLQSSLDLVQSQLSLEKSSHFAEIQKLRSTIYELRAENTKLQKKNEKLIKEKRSKNLNENGKRHILEKTEETHRIPNTEDLFELKQKLLNQADELFEKNIEIKILKNQKLEFFREMIKIKENNYELDKLREHVFSLLNTIQSLKEHIVKIVQNYRERQEIMSAEMVNEEFIKSIEEITENIDLDLERKKPAQWVDFKKFFKDGVIKRTDSMKIYVMNHINSSFNS